MEEQTEAAAPVETPAPVAPTAPDEATTALALRIAEAVIFAADRPVSPQTLGTVLPEGVSATMACAALAETYQGRGVVLTEIGGGYAFRTAADLAPRLTKVVSEAHMGTQFYLTGTEGLIGQAEREIMMTGLPFAAIQKEHRGSTLRRVQCVHCKGITENVALDPFVCSHCGLSLFVRDHYSRRLGAFQGVCIDAEEPGTAPKPEELFP